MAIDNQLAKLSEDLDKKSTRYDSVGDALTGVATTVGGAVSGAVGATLGLPTDLVGILSGLKEAATAEDGKRLDAFTDGFSEFSKENLGSQYYKGVFDKFVDSLEVDPTLKEDAKAGFSTGELITPPIAGGSAVKAVTKMDKIKDEFSRVETMAMKSKENATRKVDEIGKEFNDKAPQTYTRSEVMAMTAKREPSPVRQMTETERMLSPLSKVDADNLDDMDLQKIYLALPKTTENFDLALSQSKLPVEQLNKAEINFSNKIKSLEESYIKRKENNLAMYDELEKYKNSLRGEEYENFSEAMDMAYYNAAETIADNSDNVFGKGATKEQLQKHMIKGDLVHDGYYFSSLYTIVVDNNLNKAASFVQNLPNTIKKAPPLEIGLSKFNVENSDKLLKNYNINDFSKTEDFSGRSKSGLGSKGDKKINAPVEDGKEVSVRLNLNSKIDPDGPKAPFNHMQTIHPVVKGQPNYKQADSYKTAVSLENGTFHIDQNLRRKIAEDGMKVPAMSVQGKYTKNRNVFDEMDESVIEIGTNPRNSHLFVDLKTGQAVKGFDLATVFRDRVYAKGVTYWKKADAPKPLPAKGDVPIDNQVRYKFKRGGLMARN